MRIKGNRRGIIPDGLVQMRLQNFRKSFPNLNPKYSNTRNNEQCNVGISANENQAVKTFDEVSANHSGGSGKRKRKGKSDTPAKRRRDDF